MLIRGSTYRFQFHKDFKLSQATRLVPYLKELGVGMVYASPVFTAVPGSQHGYDTLDPNSINPELGTLEDYQELSAALKKAGIGLMQDVVPNHMAYDPRNPWIADLLTYGRQSPYFPYFDVLFGDPDPSSRLMLPFLGSSLNETLEKNEVSIVHEGVTGGVKYYETVWPVNPDTLEKGTGIKELGEAQFYRLCSWRETSRAINYRRFFTVNALICLNMHDLRVFNDFHRLIKNLIDQNIVDALRIDHVDGLNDPGKYLDDLRSLIGNDKAVYVEKILARDESLPGHWPVQGTTGYDFLAKVNNLFTYAPAREDFLKLAVENGESETQPQELIRNSKAAYLMQNMAGELDNLCRLLKGTWEGRGLQPEGVADTDISNALKEILTRLPVYRLYGNKLPIPYEEKLELEKIFEAAQTSSPRLEPVFDQLRALWFNSQENAGLAFYQRLMQFTGPLMAKGVEDTLMYAYTNFAGHNEVGDSPFEFGMSAGDFHSWVARRFSSHPYDMNTTSTHDTKRGEDVRARLNVLSEIPLIWGSKIDQWKRMNQGRKTSRFPAGNFEYFLYQNLVGTYPFEAAYEADYRSRLFGYLQKALREANRYSSWAEPNAGAEDAVEKFVTVLLSDRPFLKDLKDFLGKITDSGIFNSLSQLTLKCMLPGVPDIYQGTEHWDLSFVDPDNRLPVDFDLRLSEISTFAAAGEDNFKDLLGGLWENRLNGVIKMFLMRSLLKLRDARSQFFNKAAYIPLEATGKLKDHVFGFLRRLGDDWLLVAVPLFTSQLKLRSGDLPGKAAWGDTHFELPAGSPLSFNNVLTQGKTGDTGKVMVGDLFARFPVAVLNAWEEQHKRSAGILMHISALPSGFGIGDLGPEAYRFADFLKAAKQTVWQLLPIGPTGASQSYSPYSSFSSYAGNTLLISPEILATSGLISPKELEEWRLPDEKAVNFKKAKKVRDYLLDLAFDNFFGEAGQARQTEFELFCTDSDWLEDFALYVVIKAKHNGMPWYQWPERFRLRTHEGLEEAASTWADQLKKVKWRQFIFFKQWDALRSYCSSLGISFFGDLPFYSAYDSCDVWASQESFLLGSNGHLLAQAGVPPDYFNAEGQLWGMPVYNWEHLKASGFMLWIRRISGSLKLFDKIRLDHFRAFYDYWEVPSGETTARIGSWKTAPGAALFDKLKGLYSDLPFIAEDLGDVNENVFSLRDKFGLPGMKVIQFAFGGDTAKSPHAPHNYSSNFVVYTGTHDNNTSRGWYRKDILKKDRTMLASYTGMMISEENVASALIRLAYSSVASTAIIPLQDILNLDEKARMNTPASVGGNWSWKLVPGRLNQILARDLARAVTRYNRD